MSVADIIADVTVEIGFGVDAAGGANFTLNDTVKGVLNNVTYLLAPATVFVDVTDRVSSVATSRGRQRELDEYSTGTATVVFNDTDRTMDPSYTGSPYYGQLTPMRRIRIGWRGIQLFDGWVDDWSVTYEPGDKLSLVTAECVDGFAVLANQELDEVDESFAGDLSGERIVRVLDLDEVEYPATRAIDDGTSMLGATTLGDNVLAYLQGCSRAEAGFLFMSADGVLTFNDRTSVLNALSTVTFSDNPTTGVPYRNVTQRSSADLLFTRVTGQSEATGVTVEVVDAASEAEFLIRPLSLGTLFTIDDVETETLLNAYLDRFSSVELRFHSADVNVAACTSAQVLSLASLDLTDVVTVLRSPLGVGSAISRLSMIDGIDHAITNGSWNMALSFANADTRSYLVLDSATLGLLDTGRVA